MNQLDEVTDETHNDKTDGNRPTKLNVFCARSASRHEGDLFQLSSISIHQGRGLKEGRITFTRWLCTSVDKLKTFSQIPLGRANKTHLCSFSDKLLWDLCEFSDTI